MNRLLLSLSLGAIALAQTTPPVKSPEVHADRRVTFRVRAPKASEVTFSADWMRTGVNEKMTKGSDGVWSLTLGPLDPSVYIYTFTIDGVTGPDPVNPRVKLRSQTSASMVEVPGPTLWEPRKVPHGTVEINWHDSAVLGGEPRWVWVYTPPGYERDRSKRFPVLYLFHGNNDTAGGWVLAGHANFILDNLIAEGKAAPMIVVMPYGHAVPYGSPREVNAKNSELFEQYVIRELIPFAEAKYRVAAGRQNRAVAGLSMGGGQSLRIGLGHVDLFSAVGAFSAAIPNDSEGLIKDAKTLNSKLELLWVGCGKDDFLYERAVKFDQQLTAAGVKHTFRATEGAHTFKVWRQYLSEFAPLLFTRKPKS